MTGYKLKHRPTGMYFRPFPKRCYMDETPEEYTKYQEEKTCLCLYGKKYTTMPNFSYIKNATHKGIDISNKFDWMIIACK